MTDLTSIKRRAGRGRKHPIGPETLKGASVVPVVTMILKAGGKAGSRVREAAGRE